MRKRTLGVVLLAGLAVSGAGAFTGSNTYNNGTADTIAGYGESTATGAVVTAISYDASTTDSANLASVTFTTTTDMAGLTASVMLRDVDTTTSYGPYSCGTAVDSVTGLTPSVTTTSWRFSCAVTATVSIEDVASVGLSVTQ